MSAATKRPLKAGRDAAKDMMIFEALPAKTQALARLQAETEKTNGPAAVALQKKIRAAAAD